ncbi:MAG: DNA alkylation repair protein [Bdellovibrionota bacterium]
MSAFKLSIGPEHLRRVGKAILSVYPQFSLKSFVAVQKDLEPLELKARVQRVRSALRDLLPKDYERAVAILLHSVKDETIRGFDLWPYTDFVQTYGLDQVKFSLDALSVFTRLFTSEFAVRPFLIQSPKETLAYLLQCAASEDVHLRRWACEGSRPRLPWGERLSELVKDPSPTRPILNALKFDPELYVRKSVANHLNDIAKDHPDYVIKVLRSWQKEAETTEEKARLLWITKHSLRSLIKAGHAGALTAIGVNTAAKVKVTGFKLSEKILELGERMDFSIELTSESSKKQKIVLDYAIHYQKANGKMSPKVFKWKTFDLGPGEKVRLTKSHVLKAVTTRVHYEGAHVLAIHLNGVPIKTAKWNLTL